MGSSVAHLLLNTNEITGERKLDLPSSVAERLVAEGPALQQRVQRRVGLAFVN